jgi:transposase
MLALALVMDGYSRAEAAALNGMDRQTLSDWVHRYNELGVEGLRSGSSSGRPPALTEAQRAELRDLVIAGPDPATHGVVRWRCVDLQAEVHPQKDPEAEAAFKKTSPIWSEPRSPRPRAATR